MFNSETQGKSEDTTARPRKAKERKWKNDLPAPANHVAGAGKKEGKMQLIDVEKLPLHLQALTEIQNAPAVDAVPVVRCEECIYCELHWDGGKAKFVPYCSRYPYSCLYVIVEREDFCNYGKRNEAKRIVAQGWAVKNND